MILVDHTGETYGRLSVTGRAPNWHGHVMWQCRCSCGKSVIVRASSLTGGNSKSCGCLVREKMRQVGRANGTHRKSHFPEYAVWKTMIARCYNKKNNRYHLYGARGIRVCKRWLESFEAFLEDVGRRPAPKLSIDRYPDTNGNYEPSNVRWATASQQNKNRRPFKRRRKV